MIYSTNSGYYTIVNLKNILYANLDGKKISFTFIDGNSIKEIRYADEEAAKREFNKIIALME